MIPFFRNFEFEYGVPRAISRRVTRVVARNPGRFTWTGTGTILVGTDEVAVIDPGPDREDHIDALDRAIGGRPVACVLITHNHMDHSAIARRVADRYDAPLCGRRGLVGAEDGGSARGEAGDDPTFSPDIELHDGWRVQGGDWTIAAMHTPGHTAEHFCFNLEEENTLFCGDHVMAWSTSVVSPPDGHMGSYLASLERVKSFGFRRLVPTHGPEINSPDAFIASYIQHRLQRRDEILTELQRGARTIRRLVDVLYARLAGPLRPAAALSVWAHLIQLVEEGLVTSSGGAGLGSEYRLSRMIEATAMCAGTQRVKVLKI